jgi:hypothetical protein
MVLSPSADKHNDKTEDFHISAAEMSIKGPQLLLQIDSHKLCDTL